MRLGSSAVEVDARFLDEVGNLLANFAALFNAELQVINDRVKHLDASGHRCPLERGSTDANNISEEGSR